ncbi:tyrosine-type recombinase/integrase [Stutzerimonas stutzeri]|uniref:tyrosine-type recombinase/integrase n=1 Tax=Stutzerimonas stutzeri TaxID=316 RepID=UPI000371F26C|nr:site-specific integrase [Stutzerimonas stutzeri]
MATRKRGNKWRTEFIVEGERYVRYFEDEGEGKAWEAYVRLQVARGQPLHDDVLGADKPMTLGEAFKHACTAWEGTKNSKMAVKNAEDVLEVLGKNFPVAKVGKVEFDSLVKHFRKRELTDSTINRKLASLSKMMTLAAEHGEPVNFKIKILKEPEGRLRFLTPAEEQAVLQDLEENEGGVYADFVRVGIDTGGRLSELLAMEPRWLRYDSSGRLLLTFPARVTKSAKSRTIPVPMRSVDILAKRLDNKQVWPEHWSKFTITHAWARSRARLQIHDPEFVFHACRHTCATRLLQKTGNLVLVRDWLGHADIRITTRYTKVVSDTLLAGAEALDSFHTPSTPTFSGVESGVDFEPA